MAQEQPGATTPPPKVMQIDPRVCETGKKRRGARENGERIRTGVDPRQVADTLFCGRTALTGRAARAVLSLPTIRSRLGRKTGPGNPERMRTLSAALDRA